MATDQQGTLDVGTYVIVPEASQLNYSVKNMLLNSKGKFTQCAGEIVLGTNNEHSVHATVDTSSFDSGIHSRNQHCMQPDVLNAEEYPQMVFRSTQCTTVDDGAMKITGLMDICGSSVSTVFTVEMQKAAEHDGIQVRCSAVLDRADVPKMFSRMPYFGIARYINIELVIVARRKAE
eukprot:GEMP01068855.1.p1 GENE.GEMP01068855.1~~GEMP01068855.1.p1  ORF type:complete len:192 (+),score=42.04 GEMP01068855.1:47-577(+)